MASAIAEPTTQSQYPHVALLHGLRRVGITPHPSIEAYKKEKLTSITTRRQRIYVRLAHLSITLMLVAGLYSLVALAFRSTTAVALGSFSSLCFWMCGRTLRKKGHDWETRPITVLTRLPEEARNKMDALEVHLPGVTFYRVQLVYRWTIIYAEYRRNHLPIFWD